VFLKTKKELSARQWTSKLLCSTELSTSEK